MTTTRWFNALIIATFVFTLAGCKSQDDIVHQKSLSELNYKAQQLMQSGDLNGAVSRLEAAHDLSPTEPTTMFNLAVAYQMQGKYDDAIQLFNELLKQPGQDQAELHKNLGIAYEAKADTLNGQAAKGTIDSGMDNQTASEQQNQSIEAYKAALEHYKQALPGIKNPAPVQRQIQALETKLSNPTGSPIPQ